MPVSIAELMQSFHVCSIKNLKPLKMENNIQPTMVQTIGKLYAGAILYDFNEGRGAREFQEHIYKAKMFLGEDHLKKLFDSSSERQHAFLFACIDKAIVGALTPETKQMFANLDDHSRVFIEMIYLRATGQDPADSKQGRWENNLYKLKNLSQQYLQLSPSKVTKEELAKVVREIAVETSATLREHLAKLI